MEWFYEEAQLYDILLLEPVILPQWLVRYQKTGCSLSNAATRKHRKSMRAPFYEITASKAAFMPCWSTFLTHPESLFFR